MASTTYHGGCHCKRVRYEVSADLGNVIECNCSHCSAKGLLLTFTPATQFKLLNGENELGKYQFNKHVIDHLFCKNCGVQSFARGKRPDGTDTVAINARCLDEVDVATLKRTPYDGRSK